MHDTEPMPAVAATPRTVSEAKPFATIRVRWPTVVSVFAATVALSASLGCAYLHGEIDSLRTELHETRAGIRAAERAADRASIEAEDARTALQTANAGAEPTDPPGPVDP
jgi:hypothetical protein